MIKPYSGPQELKELKMVLKSGWLTQGKYVGLVESKIKIFNKARFAFLVNSATSGLIAAVKCLSLSKDDEVIMPSFSFPATANSVAICSGRPVFCDISLDDFNIDPEKIERLITRRTKAILVVHEFGLMAKMDKVLRIAKKYNLPVIEDAACSFGSEFSGKKAGSFGDIGVFSFHPRKILSCGEGGCVVTDSPKFAEIISQIRNHGEYGGKFLTAGYNFRLSDIQGAVLLAQFNRINTIIAKRIRLAKNYDRLLEALEKSGILKTPATPEGYRHIYQSYVILLSEKLNRDNVKSALRSRGIETQIGTHCIPTTDYYRKTVKTNKDNFKNSRFAYEHSLTLPLYHTLEKNDQIKIVDELKRILRKCAE